MAAGIPLLLGLTAVIATMGLLAIPSKVLPVDESIGAVVLLIGLAVGVDYTMFYLKREREERAEGRSPEEASSVRQRPRGGPSSSPGLTVMIAMAGMFLTGDPTFMSFGAATILVVAVAVLGSLTVLPAMLSWLGDRVERLHIPVLKQLRPKHGEGRFWSADPHAGPPASHPRDRPLGGLPRRPVPGRTRPEDSRSRGGHLSAVSAGREDLQQDAGGLPRGPDPGRGRDQGAERALPGGEGGDRPAQLARARRTAHAGADPDGRQRAGHGRGRLDPGRGIGDGRDLESGSLVPPRRDPPEHGRPRSGDRGVRVTGDTASSKDFNDQMGSRIIWVFGFVIGLAFLLLLVTFRSLVIPIKAIILNLLSVGRPTGVLTIVFQHGVGKNILDFSYTEGVAGFIPMFLFVILFGLSMDYHVFILSRVREGYDNGLSTEQAIAHGVKVTAGVVDERGDRDGLRLLDFRDARHPLPEAVRRRARGGDPDRRDGHPRDPAAGVDAAARRLELVSAEMARMAAESRAREGA